MVEILSKRNCFAPPGLENICVNLFSTIPSHLTELEKPQRGDSMVEKTNAYKQTKPRSGDSMVAMNEYKYAKVP